MWDGNTCINFTAKFLEFLKDAIPEDGVYQITFPRNGTVISVTKKPDGESFLTPEYVKWKQDTRSEL